MVFSNNEPSKGKKTQSNTKRRYANQKYSKKLQLGRATQKYAKSHQKKASMFLTWEHQKFAMAASSHRKSNVSKYRLTIHHFVAFFRDVTKNIRLVGRSK